MTLFRIDTASWPAMATPVDDLILEASPADVLRWQGWENCPTCEGSGRFQYPNCTDISPCPDCAHGLVPPDWMTEAAARGAFGDETFDHDGSDWFLSRQGLHMKQARAALVEAARKEKE